LREEDYVMIWNSKIRAAIMESLRENEKTSKDELIRAVSSKLSINRDMVVVEWTEMRREKKKT